MLRRPRSIALTILILAVAASAQDDAILAGLDSPDGAVVLTTLEKLEPSQPSPTVLKRVIQLAQGRGRGPVQQRARAYVEGLGADGVPQLLGVAEQGGRPGITALRLAARFGAPSVAPKLVAFLDHAEPRIRGAAVALLSRGGATALTSLKARHARLSKEATGEAPSQEADLRLSETLAILSALGADGVLDDILAARASVATPRLLDITDVILGRDHGHVLRRIARDQLGTGDRRNEDMLLAFLYDHGAPEDAGFALDMWKNDRGERGATLAKILELIATATHNWLGGTTTACSGNLALYDPRKKVAGREKVTYDRPHRRALRGVEMRLPTEIMLSHPGACEIVSTGDDTLAVRFDRKETYRFGIGDLRGQWIFRFGFDVARFEVRYDPATGRPLKSTCFNAEGLRSGVIDYSVRDDGMTVTVQSGTHELVARYETGRLDSAQIRRRDGKETTDLAAARLLDVVMGASKSTEGR